MKTYQVWKKVNEWEVTTLLAKNEAEARKNYKNGFVVSVRYEDADSDNGEYEIEEYIVANEPNKEQLKTLRGLK
jgi:hypothetical protein